MDEDNTVGVLVGSCFASRTARDCLGIWDRSHSQRQRPPLNTTINMPFPTPPELLLIMAEIA
jgi:hypothetical protein